MRFISIVHITYENIDMLLCIYLYVFECKYQGTYIYIYISYCVKIITNLFDEYGFIFKSLYFLVVDNS